jgi:DNA-binding NtrC family response regulator
VAYHDDVTRIGESMNLCQVVDGEALVVGAMGGEFGQSPLGHESCMGRKQFELIPWQPKGNIAVRALHESVETLVNGDRVMGTRLLNPGDTISAGRTLLVLHELPIGLDSAVQDSSSLAGVSSAVCLLRQQIAELAPSNEAVLIVGESGVGKEVVARELHALSGRSGKMASLNCRAVPASLGRGYLLGWKQGAFAGAASDRASLFEEAANGTLFLDAVAEMDVGIQESLLTIVEQGHYSRLGEESTQTCTVRLVSATNVDLQSSGFSSELYQRLAGCVLYIPPLRERPEDIPLLAYHLLRRCARDLSMSPPIIGFGLMSSLVSAVWPLNARALRTAIKNLLVAQPNQRRLAVHPVLREALGAAASSSIMTTQEVDMPTRPVPARFVTDPEFTEVAAATNYNKDEIARRLGWDPRTISRRLRKIGRTPSTPPGQTTAELEDD